MYRVKWRVDSSLDYTSAHSAIEAIGERRLKQVVVRLYLRIPAMSAHPDQGEGYAYGGAQGEGHTY